MDLRFTDEEVAFREEVRAFLRENLPDDMRKVVADGRLPSKEQLRSWTRVLKAKGWAVPHWPAAYGGTGWDPMKQYIFLEEMQKYPAPQPLALGVNMVGPVIYTFGNKEQKDFFLPRIIGLDDWWCQGFSEPGAGSDLASLKTKAVRDGDHYIVNGQKTWTSVAQHADWMFCLVRTDPEARKQEGISFLLIDMQTPGIDVRPIVTIEGEREVNEVFLTDVRVPVTNLVGEEGKGWNYAKFLLGNERTNLARVGASKQRIARIRDIAAKEMVDGKPLIEDHRFREKLASIEIELKALEITQLRVIAADMRRGNTGKPDPASSILKLKGTELQQTTTRLLMEVVGPHAMPCIADGEALGGEPVGPDYAAHAAPLYFNYRKLSIFGGTNEIQKNIIAKAVLGL
ncbi:pimeloyl-CoA dehydrogenase large subunit [Microvirga zambiensis]|uniref:pimeloyl-CoA dehydrogenase large subunit n=1 Tax=Microvirga zambiensis TaxID=1402137 RepID=UPI00191DC4AE|nr:pimeloyl-CoA dehydrogenase large subunit [Microvirga zambiensis]